ncbi:OmpA family protein [Cryomorphaceae bacterium 1068]|nr:OmpA family protein [Cryomorphaceae bacterium 1068]
MSNTYSKAILLIFTIVTLTSCVPNGKFMDVSQKQEACERENEQLRLQNEKLSTELNEFDTKYNVSERKIDALKSDTAVLGNSLRILRKQYDKINTLNDQLLSKTASLREGTEAEKQTLMAELETVRLSLLEKEDALNQLETALNTKEEELLEREAKLTELRAAITEKDSLMNALRQSVSDALLGFEGNGLTIEKRNGRVYVSMEAKLLFATGETAVDKKGQEVIIDLARALGNRDDLDIVVEGHTDTDEFQRSTFPRNNWDLSVLRATSVINIMLANSDINPEMLVAAGRSQYMPIDPNNKAKNRRIEIILSPKLNELLEMVSED